VPVSVSVSCAEVEAEAELKSPVGLDWTRMRVVRVEEKEKKLVVMWMVVMRSTK
jgi:hypothetical protein